MGRSGNRKKLSANLKTTRWALLGGDVPDTKESRQKGLFEQILDLQKKAKTAGRLIRPDLFPLVIKKESIEQLELDGIDFSHSHWEKIKGKNICFASEDEDMHASFKGASLEDVVFEKSEFSLCSFQNSSIKCSRFKDSTFWATNFSGSDLSGIDPRNVFEASIFAEANFKNSYLSGADFSGSRFRAAKLGSGLSFSNSILNATAFSDMSMPYTQLDFATAKDANFHNVVLNGTSFIEADLERARFKSINISDHDNKDRVTFEGANLDSSQFESSTLPYSDFSNASLKGTVFEGCDLSRAVFNGSQFENTRFINCNLEGIDFGDPLPRGIEFVDCKI